MSKQSIELYNGEVLIDFRPDKHWYKIGKDFIPSVTSITGQLDKSGPLMYWACNLARDYLLDIPHIQRDDEAVVTACRQHTVKKEQACTTGSLVHDYIEQWVTNPSVALPDDEKAKNGIIAFLERINEHSVEFLENERKIYSRSKNYVGTLDGIAIVDGKKTLIDWKTSNSFRKLEYGMQIAGYRQAYEEETGDIIESMLGVHFDKETGQFEVFDLTEDYEELLKGFNALVEVKHQIKVLNKLLK